MPVLEQQLALIAPRLVVPLGRHALAHFAPAARIGEAHGRAITERGRELFPLYHPAAALRSTKLRATLVRRRARAAGAARALKRAGSWRARVCCGPAAANRSPWRSWRSHPRPPSRGRTGGPSPRGSARSCNRRRRRRAARAGGRLRGHAPRRHRDRRHRAAGAVRQAHDGRRHPGDRGAAAGDAARTAGPLAARSQGAAGARLRARRRPRLRRLPRPVGPRDPAVRQPGARRGRERPAGRRAGRGRRRAARAQRSRGAGRDPEGARAAQGRTGRRHVAERARCSSCSGRPP